MLLCFLKSESGETDDVSRQWQIDQSGGGCGRGDCLPADLAVEAVVAKVSERDVSVWQMSADVQA